jgi:ferritin-like metal-binding protein YciE
MNTLDDLFQQEIGALILAKRKFVEALKLLGESISDEEMKDRVTAHLLDTLNHIQALQNQFKASAAIRSATHELSDESDIQETFENLSEALTLRKASSFGRQKLDSTDFDLVGLRKIYE